MKHGVGARAGEAGAEAGKELEPELKLELVAEQKQYPEQAQRWNISRRWSSKMTGTK